MMHIKSKHKNLVALEFLYSDFRAAEEVFHIGQSNESVFLARPATNVILIQTCYCVKTLTLLFILRCVSTDLDKCENQ